MVPNSTRCTLACISNRSSSKQSTLTMCLRSGILCIVDHCCNKNAVFAHFCDQSILLVLVFTIISHPAHKYSRSPRLREYLSLCKSNMKMAQGGNMTTPITMQYHLLQQPGGGHPGAYQPQPHQHRAPAPNNVMQVPKTLNWVLVSGLEHVLIRRELPLSPRVASISSTQLSLPTLRPLSSS